MNREFLLGNWPPKRLGKVALIKLYSRKFGGFSRDEDAADVDSSHTAIYANLVLRFTWCRQSEASVRPFTKWDHVCMIVGCGYMHCDAEYVPINRLVSICAGNLDLYNYTETNKTYMYNSYTYIHTYIHTYTYIHTHIGLHTYMRPLGRSLVQLKGHIGWTNLIFRKCFVVFIVPFVTEIEW